MKNQAEWPHQYILTGYTKERVSNDNLTANQWMGGFCHTINDYVIAQDAFHGWVAKVSHVFLLCRMEKEEVSRYLETAKK